MLDLVHRYRSRSTGTTTGTEGGLRSHLIVLREVEDLLGRFFTLPGDPAVVHDWVIKGLGICPVVSVVHDWVIKGLGMSSRVCVTG